MALVTQAEFARLAGVNRSTVTRWLQNGRIKAEPNGLIDPEAAAAMRDATESPMPHHQARKAQFDEVRGPQSAQAAFSAPGEYPSATQADPAQRSATAPATEAMPAADKIGVALKLETYKLQKAKAEQANLELDRAAGALVERTEVEAVLADIGAQHRVLMESLPIRLAELHKGDARLVQLIEGVALDLSHEYADHMKRKMETE